MIEQDTLKAINAELDRNLETLPSNIAFLIYELQTFSTKKPTRRKEILEKAIAQLRGFK